MALTDDEVRAVALLARLELPDSEIEIQARHLNKLIPYLQQLQELPESDTAAPAGPAIGCGVLREDVAAPSIAHAELLRAAPNSRDGLFLVPRIIEE